MIETNIKNLSEQEKEMYRQEAINLKSILHYNLFNFVDSFKTHQDEVCIVMKNIEFTYLFDFIIKFENHKIKESINFNIFG